ncbi:hypothetical protein ACFL7D_09815 [candidate division KSB1 bacterium]
MKIRNAISGMIGLMLILNQFFFCSQDKKPKNNYGSIEQIIENIQRSGDYDQELVFGSELHGTKDEFLLGSSDYFAVNHKNEVIVLDENNVKLFDINGRGQKIIARKGNGPGEFNSTVIPYFSPDGYLILYSGGIYNLFSPDFEFIEKKRFLNSAKLINYMNENGISVEDVFKIKEVYPLSSHEKIYCLLIKRPDVINIEVIYESKDKIFPVVKINDPYHLVYGSNVGRIMYFADFVWGLLPDRKIYYINTAEDTHADSVSYYQLHVVDIDSGRDNRYECEFEQVPIPEHYLKTFKRSSGSRSTNVLNDMLYEKLKEQKYLPSIALTNTDRNLLINYSFYDAELFDSEKDPEIFADIFNAEKKRFTEPVSLKMVTIRNGFGYISAKDEDGFPVIRRYRLNKELIGKIY